MQKESLESTKSSYGKGRYENAAQTLDDLRKKTQLVRQHLDSVISTNKEISKKNPEKRSTSTKKMSHSRS